jgi:hypothetical protein
MLINNIYFDGLKTKLMNNDQLPKLYAPYVWSGGSSIAHYNDSQWARIESGTDVKFLDVWGTPDGKIVWSAGKELDKTVLIKIENNQAKTVFKDYYPWQIKEGRISGGISSIWTEKNNFIYISTPITVYRGLSTTRRLSENRIEEGVKNI